MCPKVLKTKTLTKYFLGSMLGDSVSSQGAETCLRKLFDSYIEGVRFSLRTTSILNLC
jgi:hypothetical protein